MRVIAVDGGDEKRDLCKRLGAEAFIDFSHDQGHHGRNYENYHIRRARGANNSCKEGRVCDGAEFLTSGWDHGSSRIAEGSDSLGGRSAIIVVLEKAEYRWQCSVVGVGSHSFSSGDLHPFVVVVVVVIHEPTPSQ
jgi:hypothetical protein